MRETPRPSRSHRMYRTCRAEHCWKSSSSVAGPFLRKRARSLSPGVSMEPGLTAFTRMRRSFRSVVHVRANERTAADSIVDEVAHSSTGFRASWQLASWPKVAANGPRKLPFDVYYILFLFLA